MSEEKKGRKPIPVVLLRDGNKNPYFPQVGFEAVVDPITLNPILGTMAKEDAQHYLNLETLQREVGNEHTYLSSITAKDGQATIKVGSLDAFIAPFLNGIRRGERSLQPSAQLLEAYSRRNNGQLPGAPSDLTTIVTGLYASEDGVVGYNELPIRDISGYVSLDTIKQIQSSNILDTRFLALKNILSRGKVGGAKNQVVKEISTNEAGELVIVYGVSDAETYLPAVNGKFDEVKREYSYIKDSIDKFKEDLKKHFVTEGRPTENISFLDDYLSHDAPVKHYSGDIEDPSDPTLRGRILNDIRYIKEGNSFKTHLYYSNAPDLSKYAQKDGAEFAKVNSAIREEKDERKAQGTSIREEVARLSTELREADSLISARVDDLAAKTAPFDDVATILEQNAKIEGKYNALNANVTSTKEQVAELKSELNTLKNNEKLSDDAKYVRVENFTTEVKDALDLDASDNNVIVSVVADESNGTIKVGKALLPSFSEYAKTAQVSDLVGDAVSAELPQMKDELAKEFYTKEEVDSLVTISSLSSSVEVVGEELQGDPSDTQIVKSVSVKNDLSGKRKLVVEYKQDATEEKIATAKSELEEKIRTNKIDLELHVNGVKVEGEGEEREQGKTYITSSARLLKRGENGLTLDVKEEAIDLSALINIDEKVNEIKTSVKSEVKTESESLINSKVQELTSTLTNSYEQTASSLTTSITSKGTELSRKVEETLTEAKKTLSEEIKSKHSSVTSDIDTRFTRATSDINAKITELNEASKKFKEDVASAISEVNNAQLRAKNAIDEKVKELTRAIGEFEAIKNSYSDLRQQVTNEIATLSSMKLELAKVNVVSVASELKRDRSFTEVLKGEKGDEGKKGDAPILFVSGSGDASELRYKYTSEGQSYPINDEEGSKFFLKNLKGAKGDQGIPGVKGNDGADGESAYEIAKRTNRTTATTEGEWIASLKGEAGKNIQLITNEGQVKWRYEGETDYKKLYDIPAIDSITHITSGVNKGRVKFSVAGKEYLVDNFSTEELRGKSPKFRKGENSIQYRYSDNEDWTDLVLIRELKGDEGKKGEAPILFVEGSDDLAELMYKYGNDGQAQSIPNPNGSKLFMSTLKGPRGTDGTDGHDGKAGARGVRFFWSKGVYKTAPSDVVASINPNFLELEKNPAENEVFATFLTNGVTDRTETLIEGDNIYNPETLDVFTLRFDTTKKNRFALSYVTNIRGLQGVKGEPGAPGAKGDPAVIPAKIMERLRKIAEGEGDAGEEDGWGVVAG